MSVAIVSSVYGDYDTPIDQLAQTVDVEYVLVSDREHEVSSWRQVVEPRPHMHPRMAAKVAKCRPDLYTDAHVTIWVDASFVIQSERFVEWCCDYLGGGQIAQLVHPERVSIVDEADVSARMRKYDGHPVVEQAAHYLKAGFPDPWGLWATGLIVRRSTQQTIEFGDEWLWEQTRWTYQDQISEPMVLWERDLEVESMPGNVFAHQMFSVRPHASWS